MQRSNIYFIRQRDITKNITLFLFDWPPFPFFTWAVSFSKGARRERKGKVNLKPLLHLKVNSSWKPESKFCVN